MLKVTLKTQKSGLNETEVYIPYADVRGLVHDRDLLPEFDAEYVHIAIIDNVAMLNVEDVVTNVLSGVSKHIPLARLGVLNEAGAYILGDCSCDVTRIDTSTVRLGSQTNGRTVKRNDDGSYSVEWTDFLDQNPDYKCE